MTVVAEIKARDRMVLSYLTKPTLSQGYERELALLV
jgi:hypothetical protein